MATFIPRTAPISEEGERRRLAGLQYSKGQGSRLAPNFNEALSARIERGLSDSTLGILADIVSRPSDNEEPKLSTVELYNKYPGTHWNEPLTEKQAAWRVGVLKERQRIDEIIEDREQGVPASVLGFTSELVTSAAFSPETYVAPVMGKLSRVMASSLAKQGFLRSAASYVPKNKFAAGVAEDLVASGLVYSPTYYYREDLLENPHSASDYFKDLLLTSVASGGVNMAFGSRFELPELRKEMEDASSDLITLVTGVGEPRVPAVMRKYAVAEQTFSEPVGDWLEETGFTGDVRVVNQPSSKARSTYSSKDNVIVLNTAKISNSQQLRDALQNPSILEKPMKSKIRITRSGIAPVSDVNPPPVAEREAASHTRYNPSNPPPDYFSVETRRIEEETLEYMDDPIDEGARELSEFFEDSDFKFNITENPSTTRKLSNQLAEHMKRQKEPSTSVPDFVASEEQMKLARVLDDSMRIAAFLNKKARKLLREIKTDKTKKMRLEDLANEESSPQILKFLDDAGIDSKTAHRLTQAELHARIDRQFRRHVIQEGHRAKLQADTREIISTLGEKGRDFFHAIMDGTLRNGNYAAGGRNLFSRMDTSRNELGQYVDQLFQKHGIGRYLSSYDKEAAKFFKELSRALSGADVADPVVKEVADGIRRTNELLRRRLNKGGAGVRRLDDFFFRTIHNVDQITENQGSWLRWFLDGDNVDWERMGFRPGDMNGRRAYANKVLDDIVTGRIRPDVVFDPEAHGGKKGQAFSHERAIHFQPGQQVEYNDLFGNQNTGRELMDQLELRAKAVALQEFAGPDFKQFWSDFLAEAKERKIPDKDLKFMRRHWDDLTGEASIPEDQDLATWGGIFRNFVVSITLPGTGITTLLSDPISQIAHLRSSGLSSSMLRATKEVAKSYAPAFRQLVTGSSGKKAQDVASLLLLPHDTNLAVARRVLGESGHRLDMSMKGKLAAFSERMSLATLKYSGTGIFTKLSQMSTLYSSQKRLGYLIANKADRGKDFYRYLDRYGMTEKQFDSLSEYVIDGHLSTFHIESRALRNKVQGMLHQGLRVGSLTSDPYQTALVHWGSKSGTLAGELNRGATMFLAPAIGVHQKLLMRMAILGGGDARFMSLINDRSRFLESVTLMGMMLGSAAAIVTVKDALRNKEPFWAGDKPLAREHMLRILKVSGIAPLLTETLDTLKGGVGGQVLWDAYMVGDTFIEGGDFWEIAHAAKSLSPFIGTNIGPMPTILENMVGFASHEYLQDMRARQKFIAEKSGQGKLFD